MVLFSVNVSVVNCSSSGLTKDQLVLPAAKQWILTLLSLFWCLGQLLSALCGWVCGPRSNLVLLIPSLVGSHHELQV